MGSPTPRAGSTTNRCSSTPSMSVARPCVGWPIRATGYPLALRSAETAPSTSGRWARQATAPLDHAFGPDGHPRTGWPTTLPRTADFTLAPDGPSSAGGTRTCCRTRTRRPVCADDVHDDRVGRQDARRMWPITSIGTATAPVVVPRTGASSTTRPRTADRAGLGPRPEREHHRRLALSADVQSAPGAAPGWSSPVHSRRVRAWGRHHVGLPGDRAHHRRQDSVRLALPDECLARRRAVLYRPPPYYPHALSADGTLYLAPWTEDRAEVVALDRRGQVVAGWPHRLPAGSRVAALEKGSAGQLVVSLRDGSAQLGTATQLPRGRSP